MKKPSLTRWNDPSLKNSRKGEPLAIVATGPSYDLLQLKLLNDMPIFAVNAAITEFHLRKDVTWVCHDMHKILRQGIKKHLSRYKWWNLVTRRVYIPGEFGDVPWAGVGWIPQKGQFPFKLDKGNVDRSTIYWYADIDSQEGFCLRSETAVQVALEVATFWGFSPIYLVGVDMGLQKGQAYGMQWKWKHCKIKPFKFEKMKASFIKMRPRWAEDIYTLSPYWPGPFKPLSVAEFRQRVHQTPPVRAPAETP